MNTTIKNPIIIPIKNGVNYCELLLLFIFFFYYYLIEY